MKYPFKVYQTQVDGHAFWVAECQTLKGCVGQGNTIEEACASLEENEEIWLETAEEFGIDIPPIPFEPMTEYSGKFTVRIAPYVHKEASENAKKQGVSLNQYVNDAIVAQNNRLLVIGYIVPEVRNVVASLRRVLSDVSQTISEGTTHISLSTIINKNMKVNMEPNCWIQ